MTDQRSYDRALVQGIRDKQHVEAGPEVDVIVKPIPDDDRNHVLDPRVREVAARKKAMFEARAAQPGGSGLAEERWRPDKQPADLCEHPVERRERIVDIDGTHRIAIYTYRRDGAPAPAPVVVFLHGGGFTAGSERIYRNQMRYLAEVSGALVVFPEYRLAPECPFPAAIEDALAAIRWVRANADELGADAGRVLVAGDSAGGSLSSAVALSAPDLVHGVYLVFPGADMSNVDELTDYEWSYALYPVVDEDRELAYSRIRRIEQSCHGTAEGNLYVQGRTSLRDPLVSAVYANEDALGAWPPTTVAVSEYDYLRPGAEHLAKRLQAAGVPTRYVLYKGVDHGFLDLFGAEPQAEELCLDIADQVAQL